MKNFKSTSKKLFVQKETIANLSDSEMTHVKGGHFTKQGNDSFHSTPLPTKWFCL